MVAERLIAPVLKTGVRLRGPGVQIPPIPPIVLLFYARSSSVVEHLTCNEVAVGSTPTEGSTFAKFYLCP